MDSLSIPRPGSSSSTQPAKMTFNDLPDELLSMIYSFNAVRIFEIQDLDCYLASARVNKASYHCAVEMLHRHFHLQSDADIKQLRHQFLEVDVWAGTYPSLRRATKDLKTRHGDIYPRHMYWNIRVGANYLLLAAVGKWVLSGRKAQKVNVGGSVRDILAITFHLRAASSSDVHYAPKHVDLIARDLPELKTVTLNFELEEPTWLQCGYVSRHLEDLIGLFQDRGCSVRITRGIATRVAKPVLESTRAYVASGAGDLDRSLEMDAFMYTGICAGFLILLVYVIVACM